MKRTNRDFWFKLLGAALIGVLLFCLMPLGRMVRAENDFVHWYVGGLLFGTPDLHLQAPNHAKQVQLLGATLDHSYFIRPTFYGFFLKPLTWLPYLTSYWLYQTYSLGALLFFLWTFSRQWPDIWVYAAMSVPILSHMVNGQDVTSLLLFCTVSLLLARRNYDFLGGVVFALCAIKFHLFILTPFAMIAHRRWRLFAGAVVGEVVLFLIGWFAGGWPVFLSLVALLRRPENHPYPELMPNLRGMVYALSGNAQPAVYLVLCAALSAAALYLIWTAKHYEASLAYAIMAGLVINFHAYIQDPVLLLLCAALLFDGRESAALRTTIQLLLLPVVYVLLLWQPPYSGIFGVLILIAFSVAVRDHIRFRAAAAT